MSPDQQLKQLHAMRAKPVVDRLAFLKYEAQQILSEFCGHKRRRPSLARAAILQRFDILRVLPPADVFSWASDGQASDAMAVDFEARFFRT